MVSTVQQQVPSGTVRQGSLLKTVLGYLWRVPACALIYVVGLAVGGAVVAAMGLEMPKLPGEMSQEQMGQGTLLSALVLVLGLAPLAARHRGVCLTRWLALALFAYVSFGLNTAIEASIFTKMGGMTAQALMFVLPVVLMAAGVAWSFGSSGGTEGFAARADRFFGARHPLQWVWRLPAAVLSFLVVYWTFGMLLMVVRPGLMQYYTSGAIELQLPSVDAMVATQLMRSSFFLAAALPVMILWEGSRKGLWLALGLALTATVGLAGMVAAAWMPMEMRIGHGLEIAADSFAHAAALVWLLAPRRRVTGDGHTR